MRASTRASRRAGVARAPRASDSGRDELARIRELIELEEIIVEGAKGKFWASIKRKIMEKGMIARVKMNEHEKMGPEERAIWVERFLRYEWIISVVERAPRELDILERKFAKLKSDLENVGKDGYNG